MTPVQAANPGTDVLFLRLFSSDELLLDDESDRVLPMVTPSFK